jgi:hypothetical protein
MEEQFIEFLKERKLKLSYERELLKHRGITLKKYLSRYSWRRAGAHKVLQNGISFIESEQGRDFWLIVNAEWRELVRDTPKV